MAKDNISLPNHHIVRLGQYEPVVNAEPELHPCIWWTCEGRELGQMEEPNIEMPRPNYHYHYPGLPLRRRNAFYGLLHQGVHFLFQHTILLWVYSSPDHTRWTCKYSILTVKTVFLSCKTVKIFNTGHSSVINRNIKIIMSLSVMSRIFILVHS